MRRQENESTSDPAVTFSFNDPRAVHVSFGDEIISSIKLPDDPEPMPADFLHQTMVRVLDEQIDSTEQQRANLASRMFLTNFGKAYLGGVLASSTFDIEMSGSISNNLDKSLLILGTSIAFLTAIDGVWRLYNLVHSRTRKLQPVLKKLGALTVARDVLNSQQPVS